MDIDVTGHHTYIRIRGSYGSDNNHIRVVAIYMHTTVFMHILTPVYVWCYITV